MVILAHEKCLFTSLIGQGSSREKLGIDLAELGNSGLSIDSPNMSLDGVNRNMQLVGNLLISVAKEPKKQDSRLLSGQIAGSSDLSN